MTDTGKRMGEVLRIMGVVIVGGTLISTMILNYKKPRFNGFESAFWTNRTGYFKAPFRARARARSNAPHDVSTPQGWHGTVALDGDGERMEMNLVDRVGNPVRGLLLAATIRRPGGGSARAYRVMALEQDGRYRTDKLNLGKGRWDLTVTARDDKATDRPALKFRIEKQVTVD